MAGKSTFLRQNAIIAIMAQMGSFVPAKSAHIGYVDKVFSRVGASDDLARGRSTFMVEMVETASILNRADRRSFVILMKSVGERLRLTACQLLGRWWSICMKLINAVLCSPLTITN